MARWTRNALSPPAVGQNCQRCCDMVHGDALSAGSCGKIAVQRQLLCECSKGQRPPCCVRYGACPAARSPAHTLLVSGNATHAAHLFPFRRRYRLHGKTRAGDEWHHGKFGIGFHVAKTDGTW
jgi:hypothetical protein